MARFMPALPLIGGGEIKLQPVFAGDVATAIALAVEGKATPGTIYELGGPEVATLRRINEFVLKVTQRRRRLVSVSFERAKLLAFVTQAVTKLSLGLFPEIFRITRDQVELLRVDNIVSPQAVAPSRPSCRLISTVTAKPDNSPAPALSERSTSPRRRTRRLSGLPHDLVGDSHHEGGAEQGREKV
jgi:hypothetical protein